jgi:2-haloacid dehalogenase
MRYKALLFDLDNTLLDFTASEKIGLDKVHAAYFNKHISRDKLENIYHAINKHLWRLVECNQCSVDFVKLERFRLLVEATALSFKHEELAELYENTIAESADWYPGVKETLTTLKTKHRLGIVTNGLAQVQQTKYQRLEINKLCECYLISDVLGIAKPDKEIFTVALKQLNLRAEEVLMIGDSLASDYQGAINAGLDFCWVNNQNQLLPTQFPTPAYMISSVTELEKIFAEN